MGRAYFAIAGHCGHSQTAKRQIERAIDLLDEAPMERCAAQFVHAANELSRGNTRQARILAEQAMSEVEKYGWQVCCGMRSYVTLAMAQHACGDHAAARRTAAVAHAVLARVCVRDTRFPSTDLIPDRVCHSPTERGVGGYLVRALFVVRLWRTTT